MTLTDQRHEYTMHRADCCIVGGGPAGAMLGLLLARQGVAVTLLEAHATFDRDFRGNTINASVMQIMDQLGLAERLLRLPHAKIARFTVRTDQGSNTFADFSRLKSRHPYLMMLPQVSFLNFVVEEARQYPHFRCIMGATVQELVEEGGTVHGVRYQATDGWHDVRAHVTIGADGRFSRVRRMAGLRPVRSTPALDALWFYLPRAASDAEEAGASFRLGSRGLLVLMDHFDCWQVGYLIAKDSYQRVREAGLPALRHAVASLAPEFSSRVSQLESWKQVSMLSVESSYVRRWYRPGLLLIGDAAHAMSPIGGIGINYAIQDAVSAANILGPRLKAHALRVEDLRAVQRRRTLPTRIIQAIQAVAHYWVAGTALEADGPVCLSPLLRLCMRLPIVRDLPARLIAHDLFPARVRV